VKKIELITFKGCQTAIDLGRQMTDLIQAENLDAEVETIVVPSLEKAEEMGLHGSPTILVDGEEYQKQPFSQAGFY
jgi:2-hydroxychromene-2-carboxylate isomerase